jgi:hypothetical protein
MRGSVGFIQALRGVRGAGVTDHFGSPVIGFSWYIGSSRRLPGDHEDFRLFSQEVRNRGRRLSGFSFEFIARGPDIGPRCLPRGLLLIFGAFGQKVSVSYGLLSQSLFIGDIS